MRNLVSHSLWHISSPHSIFGIVSSVSGLIDPGGTYVGRPTSQTGSELKTNLLLRTAILSKRAANARGAKRPSVRREKVCFAANFSKFIC